MQLLREMLAAVEQDQMALLTHGATMKQAAKDTAALAQVITRPASVALFISTSSDPGSSLPPPSSRVLTAQGATGTTDAQAGRMQQLMTDEQSPSFDVGAAARLAEEATKQAQVQRSPVLITGLPADSVDIPPPIFPVRLLMSLLLPLVLHPGNDAACRGRKSHVCLARRRGDSAHQPAGSAASA